MAEYEKQLSKYESKKKDYDSKRSEFDSKKTEYDSGRQEYESGLEKYESKLAEYDSKKKEYDDGDKTYAAGKAEYDQKKKEYDDGLAQYNESRKKLNAAEDEYSRYKQELEDGKEKYNKNMDDYANAVNEMDNKKQKLANVEQCRWFQFDLNSNLGYVSLDMNADSLSKLGKSFALLFVVVGAMVCYATIGRMVDEQRKLVGASKALGLFNSEIFKKYIFFGMSAVVFGILIGTAAAYFGVQKAVLLGNASTFAFGEAGKVFKAGMTVMVFVFGVILGFAATYIACSKLLRSTAVVLMKEKVPNSVKSSRGGRKTGTLYSRLILRNMLCDLKRVAVTVISVAGCCSLLVIGFTLKFSMDKVLTRQFEEIINYDNNLVFSSERSETAAADMSAKLDEFGCSYIILSKETVTCQLGDQLTAVDMYISAPEQIDGYYTLNYSGSKEKIDPADWQDGLLIQRKVSEICGVKPGDTITIYDTNAKKHSAKVAGIFDNYLGRTMFMSDSYYEELFGTPVRNSQFFIKLNGADPDAVKRSVSSVKGFKNFNRSDSSRDFFASFSIMLNAVIIGMILMAAAMASVVLLNLTNMYLMQKTRELAIMRINGFTLGQSVGYLARETVITTVTGIILGIAGGSALALQIIRSMEKPSMQLIREPDFLAWALAAVITALFTFIINFIVMRKVKDLRLTDLAG